PRALAPLPLFSCPATAPPVIYTLSLHDALPISASSVIAATTAAAGRPRATSCARFGPESAATCAGSQPQSASTWLMRSAVPVSRSEEHTSELQSRENLVCRLLLEKKKYKTDDHS